MTSEYFTYRFPCGLRLIQRADDSPVVYLGYRVAAGSRHEGPSEEGIAHFCEHMSFKGTRRRGARQIGNYLESVGGDLNAFTTKDDTVYHAAVLRQHVARAIDLLTDIVFHSTYPQEEINKEVEVICDEIQSYNDSPAELIYDDFDNLLFSGHPLGHNILGDADRVRTFTTADARAFTSRLYRPSNAVFFLYGGAPLDAGGRAEQRLRRLFPAELFEPATAGAVPAEPSAPLPPLPDKLPGSVITRTRHTHQTHVMMGVRAYTSTDPHRTALQLLNNMLGGPGMSARLNVCLRERRGLVYTVESVMTAYRDAGLWTVYFGCDPTDTSRCLRLVKSELRRVISRPPSARTLAAAKRQLKGQIGIACDNRENFALDFAKYFLYRGTGRDIHALCDAIDAVTPDDIAQTACDILNPDHLVTLIYE